MAYVSIKITATNRNCADYGVPHEFTSFRDYLEWDREGFDEIYRDYLDGETWNDHDGARLTDTQLRMISERLVEAYPDGLEVDGDCFQEDDGDDPYTFQGFYNRVCEYIADFVSIIADFVSIEKGNFKGA